MTGLRYAPREYVSFCVGTFYASLRRFSPTTATPASKASPVVPGSGITKVSRS